MKMHEDQLDTSVELARSLVGAQFPKWADLPIVAVESTGTSNAMYRLGDDMVVRLPLLLRSGEALQNELTWLPRLAPQLPLAIPVAIAKGKPAHDYPSPWSICPWLPGSDGISAGVDLDQAARDLADFMAALQAVDTEGAPVPDPAKGGRGVSLATRDASLHRSLAKSTHLFDVAALTQIWDQAVNTPEWHRDAVWVHGDYAAGNLLFTHGRLSGVIDWAPMGIGDPACDLIIAWEFFDESSRAILRKALEIDDDTWARSRGWALSTAVDAAYYYEHTNRFMFEQAMHKLNVLQATN